MDQIVHMNLLLFSSITSLAKVLVWNSFRVKQNYSDSFRYLYPSQCKSFRSNPKNVLYLIWWKTVKNQFDLIRLIPRHQSEWIRMNLKQSETNISTQINPISDLSKPNFQSESIRMNPRSEWFELIWIEILVSDWIGFIRIDVSELIGLRQIDFWPLFIKRDTKRFSDWFGMIRIGSDTDIGMNRNSSAWLGMNFNPILLPGMLLKDTINRNVQTE